jgi:hypothetical protein
LKQPLNGAGGQPWTPKESKKAISIIQKIQSQESSMSCATTPRQAPAPIPGVPFCVNCKAHVVTHESQIQHLDSGHKTMRHQGKILVDLLPPMSQEADLYETRQSRVHPRSFSRQHFVSKTIKLFSEHRTYGPQWSLALGPFRGSDTRPKSIDSTGPVGVLVAHTPTRALTSSRRRPTGTKKKKLSHRPDDWMTKE